jgi:hypothetical protein
VYDICNKDTFLHICVNQPYLLTIAPGCTEPPWEAELYLPVNSSPCSRLFGAYLQAHVGAHPASVLCLAITKSCTVFATPKTQAASPALLAVDQGQLPRHKPE